MNSIHEYIFNPRITHFEDGSMVSDQVAQRVRGGLYPAPVIEVWNNLMQEVAI